MSEPTTTTAAVVNLVIATAVVAVAWRATNYSIDAGLKASEDSLNWLKGVSLSTSSKKTTP